MAYPTKTDRETILAAATRQVETLGAEALTIRSVASGLNLAPTALYRYFTDRAALESAISAHAVRELHASMSCAAENKSPAEAFRALAAAYLAFARQRPHIYSMVMRQCDACEEDQAAPIALWNFVLVEAERVGGKEKAQTLAMSLWALLHGVTALDHAPVLANANQDDAFTFGVEALIAAVSG